MFAGLTVVIALAGLAVVGIPLLTIDGLRRRVSVVLAVIVALTLMPALLGCVRHGSCSSRRCLGAGDPEDDTNANVGHRVARFIARFRVVARDCRGRPRRCSPPRRWAWNSACPATTACPPTQHPEGLRPAVRGLRRGQNGSAQVAGRLRRATDSGQAPDDCVQARIVRRAWTTASDRRFSEDCAGALFQVVPDSEPDNQATEISSPTPRREAASRNTSATSTASPAHRDEHRRRPSRLQRRAAARIWRSWSGLAFLLLMVVFRSILVPLTAALGFLLSVAATLGATVAVFQEGRLGAGGGTGPIVSFMPIFLIGRRLRPGHGLPGLPGDPDARGVRPRRERPSRPSSPDSGTAPGWSRPPRSS